MHSSQFDALTRLFANTRVTRRTALAAAGGGLLAAGVAPAAAQDASPAAGDATPTVPSDTGKVPFMFVQTLGAGSLAPKAGEENVLLLTADHLAGQTIYFSDRPERIVGMMPTDRFLGTQGDSGLGFSPIAPPNAALVLAAAEDQPAEIVVLELMNPTYDASTGLVTYEVRVLEAFDDIDLQLQQETLTAAEAEREFAAASLFIDDCNDGTIVCFANGEQVGESASMGFCFNYDIRSLCCEPCASPPLGSWTAACNSWYPDACQGNCSVGYNEAWNIHCTPY